MIISKYNNTVDSTILSRFLSKSAEVVKERWQLWVPWEIAVSRGLENSLHFVIHASTNKPPMHLSQLYPVSKPDDIESVCAKIARKYKVISTNEYVDRLKHRKLKERDVLATVTCDDGLRDFKTNIWPIMKKYSIPCTLFLVKNFVEKIELFYRFKTSLILNVLNNSEISRMARDYLEKLGKPIDPKISIKTTIAGIHHPGDIWLLDRLLELLDIDAGTYFDQMKPFIDRSDVVALHNDGVRLGSHGVHHYRYDLISSDEIEADILDGVTYIQELSGQMTVEHAFPFNGRTVSRELLSDLLIRQPVLTHFFDTGGIRRDEPFVTHRVVLDRKKPQRALRLEAYEYMHSK